MTNWSFLWHNLFAALKHSANLFPLKKNQKHFGKNNLTSTSLLIQTDNVLVWHIICSKLCVIIIKKKKY